MFLTTKNKCPNYHCKMVQLSAHDIIKH